MKKELVLVLPAASILLLAGCASDEMAERGPAHGAVAMSVPVATVEGLDANQCTNLRTDSPQTLYRLQQGLPLDQGDIQAMSRAGISDDLIINRIRSSHSVYYLTTQQIVDLSQSQVSSRVIDCMRATAGTAASGVEAAPTTLAWTQRELLRVRNPATLERFERGEPLTIRDIEALASAGVDSDRIIDQIRNVHCVYNLAAQDIVDLNHAGVSSRVIDCMRNTSVVAGNLNPSGLDSLEVSVRDRLRKQNSATWERFEHDLPLSVTDVKVLSNAGVKSDTLIDHLRDSRAVYQLTTQDVVDLNQAGVSSKVVDYMLNTPRFFAFTPSSKER
jgi:hypothetical protein